MKKNASLCAVASAGIIFLLFSLVAQLTLAHPGSGIFHSIGLILVTIFQLVFWIIGLVIGVALCIAVMLCIYVASAYLVNRSQGAEVAARTKLLACTQVRRILTFVAPQYFGEFAGAEACCGSACASVEPPEAPVVTPTLPETLQRLEARLSSIDSTVQSLETKAAHFVKSQQPDELHLILQQHEDAAKKEFAEKMALMQAGLDAAAQRDEHFEAAISRLDDIAIRLAEMEQRVSASADLANQMDALKGDLSGNVQELHLKIATLKDDLQQQISAVPAQNTHPAPKAAAAHAKSGNAKAHSNKKKGSAQ